MTFQQPQTFDGPIDRALRAELFIAAARAKTHIHDAVPCVPCLNDLVYLGTHAFALLSALNRAQEKIEDLEAELATRPKPPTIEQATRHIRKPKRMRPCGTEAAYERHRKKGEEPCQLCKEFMRPIWAARRAGKGRHNGGSGAKLADALGRYPVEVANA